MQKKGGLYCNPFIGVRFMTTKKQAVNLGIGYSMFVQERFLKIRKSHYENGCWLVILLLK